MTVILVLAAAWLAVALLLPLLVPELGGLGCALWPLLFALALLYVLALGARHWATRAEAAIPRAVVVFARRSR